MQVAIYLWEDVLSDINNKWFTGKHSFSDDESIVIQGNDIAEVTYVGTYTTVMGESFDSCYSVFLQPNPTEVNYAIYVYAHDVGCIEEKDIWDNDTTTLSTLIDYTIHQTAVNFTPVLKQVTSPLFSIRNTGNFLLFIFLLKKYRL